MADKLIKILGRSLILGSLICSSGCIVPYNYPQRPYERLHPHHDYIAHAILGFPGHYESTQREPIQKEPERIIKNPRIK